MAFDEQKNYHLQELGDSDFEIKDGEPNIKGWDVKNEDGLLIGNIDDLLFDPQSRKVRYLVIDIADNELDLEADKKILVPIGIARLYSQDDIDDDDDDEDDDLADGTRFAGIDDEDPGACDPREDGDVVILPGVTDQQIINLPAYEMDALTPEFETSVRSILEGTGRNTYSHQQDEFYSHSHFNDGHFNNPRTPPGAVPLVSEQMPANGETPATGEPGSIANNPAIDPTVIDEAAEGSEDPSFIAETAAPQTEQPGDEAINDALRTTGDDTERIDPETGYKDR